MKQKKSCLTALALGILLFGGLIVLHLFHIYNILNADMSSELVLADQLAGGSGILSKNWYYSTEIRVVNTQIISALLFKITDNWQMVRIGTNIILWLICGLAFAFLGKGLKLDNRSIAFAELLLLTPFSREYLNVLQFGGFYYPHIILMFFASGALLRCGQKKRWAFLWWLLSFVMGVAGLRYLLAFHIPSFCAGVTIVLCSHMNFFEKRRLTAWKKEITTIDELKRMLHIGLGCFWSGIGYLFNVMILGRLFVFKKYNTLSYRQLGENGESIFDPIGKVFMGIPEVFGFRYGAKLISLNGIYNILVIILTIIIILFVVHELKSLIASKTKKPAYSQQFVLLLFVFSFLANSYIFIFIEENYTSRYWIVVVQLLIPLLACWMTNTANRKVEEQRIFIGGGVFVALGMIAGLLTLHEAVSYNHNSSRYQVNQFLSQQNLKVGYSTFWNANITTEMTNGDIKMIPISGPTDFTIFKWLTPIDTYYKERQEADYVFILLDHNEVLPAVESDVYRFGSNIYNDKFYSVYLFDRAYMDQVITENNN